MYIKGTVIKLELETPLTLIQKPNVGLENSNQKDHIEVHSENQELLRKPKNVYKQSFRCEICEKYFKMRSQMQRHVKKVHEKASETKCELCEKTFSDAYCLMVHMNTFHSKKKNFICDTCEQSFVSKAALIGHIQVRHDKTQTSKCDTCDKEFTSKLGLSHGKCSQQS